jgi:hypothetical protein
MRAEAITGPQVTVYPPLPGNLYKSQRYTVAVTQNGRSYSSYVYQVNNRGDLSAWTKKQMTEANHWTSFSFAGSVTVKVQLLGGLSVRSAVVRPISRGVTAAVSGNTVSFSIDRPGNFYVEIPGQEKHPLFIFANPPETDVPSRSDPKVVYFGPGLHDVGMKYVEKPLPSGTTVYLAGGAYVKGLFKAQTGADSLTLTFKGRGILSGIDFPHNPDGWSRHLIRVPGSRTGNVRIEGITLTDSPKACIDSSTRTTVDNVKFFGWHHNTDGVSVGGYGSSVSNSFFKVNDDVIKLYDSNMTVTNNTFWMQPTGAAFQLSWDLSRPVTNVRVSGADFIHFDRPAAGTITIYDRYNNAVVSSQNLSGARFGPSIVIENLRFEARPYQLLDLRIKGNRPGLTSGRGSIEGMTLRNWSVGAVPIAESVIDGNGIESGEIKNVIFENIVIGGTRLTGANARTYIVRQNKTSGIVYR